MYSDSGWTIPKKCKQGSTGYEHEKEQLQKRWLNDDVNNFFYSQNRPCENFCWIEFYLIK